VSVLVLVVDDEPDVEALFRQQFRRDLRGQRFVMDFAASASDALARGRGSAFADHRWRPSALDTERPLIFRHHPQSLDD
jgi:CheY-like chemotaxis protein